MEKNLYEEMIGKFHAIDDMLIKEGLSIAAGQMEATEKGLFRQYDNAEYGVTFAKGIAWFDFRVSCGEWLHFEHSNVKVLFEIMEDTIRQHIPRLTEVYF